MRTPDRRKTGVLTFEHTTSPRREAQIELLLLAEDPRFQPNFVLGGHTPPDMLAENARRVELRYRERLQILKKHGLLEEELKKLQERADALKAKLAEVEKKIADLQSL